MKGFCTPWARSVIKGILSLACLVSAGSLFGAGSSFEDATSDWDFHTFKRTEATAPAPAFPLDDYKLPPCTSQPTEIGGTVFRDYNASGTKNTAEPGFSGVTVNAYDDDDDPTSPSATTTTASDGTHAVCTVGIDGSRFTILGDGRAPSYAPEGSSIAFVRKVNGFDQIYLVDADKGTSIVQLTSDHLAQEPMSGARRARGPRPLTSAIGLSTGLRVDVR